jgi:hypothetical protein
VGNIGLVEVNSTAKQKKTSFFLSGSNKTDVLIRSANQCPDFREIFSVKNELRA